MLYQLSYAPGSARIVSAHSGGSGSGAHRCEDYALPVQRRALGILFGTLAAVFAATAVWAAIGAGSNAGRWVVTAASAALAAWLGSLAASVFRSR